MRYRKLRIAWSMVWGLSAALLLGLLVLSYRESYSIWPPSPDSMRLHIWCENGWLEIRASWFAADNAEARKRRDFERSSTGWFVGYKNHSEHSWRYVFGRYGGNWNLIVDIGTWVPLIISAFVGSIPWWCRLPSTRFSLRTLLIATTLVAVVLGLIAWSLRG
jgi:hypothetical protein